MMLLRLVSLAAGVLVLIAPAVLIRVGGMPADMGKAGAALACVLLAAGGFFLVGMVGQRLRRVPGLRMLAAVLLGVPAVASAALLWRGGAPVVLLLASAIVGLSALLCLTLVYRPLPTLAQRWRRARMTLPGD